MTEIAALRKVVQTALDETFSAPTAVFFAYKLVALSSEPRDVLLLAKALRNDGQYRRANEVIASRGLLVQPRFLLLAAQCLADCGEWDECRQTLERYCCAAQQQQHPAPQCSDPTETGVQAALWSLRGRANAAVEKRAEARRCFEQALAIDPLCYDALARLVDGHLLPTAADEDALLTALEPKLAATAHGKWLAGLYRARMAANGGGRAACEATVAKLSNVPSLASDPDTLTARAEVLFARQFFREAHQTTSQLLQRDPHILGGALLVHVSCLVELRLEEELSTVARRLSEDVPEKAITWYAIGCFSFLKGDFESARSHFAKAMTLDRSFAAAWLAFGHTFARRNEHDQAIAAYRTVMRIFPGCHLAPLCLGMELALSNNLRGAQKFLQVALEACPEDPLVHNELGANAYNLRRYDEAATHFEKAIELALALGEHGLPVESLETLISNHAHALRKLGRLDEAEAGFRKALGLCPSNAATHAALGYTLHCHGKLSEATTAYHKSLSLRDDSLTTDFFNHALHSLYLSRR